MTENNKNSTIKVKRGEELFKSFGFGNKNYKTSDISQIKERLREIFKKEKSNEEKIQDINKIKVSDDITIEDDLEKEQKPKRTYKDETLKKYQQKTIPDYELNNICYSKTPMIVGKYNIITNPRTSGILKTIPIKTYYKDKKKKGDFPYKRLGLGICLSIGIVRIVNKITNI